MKKIHDVNKFIILHWVSLLAALGPPVCVGMTMYIYLGFKYELTPIVLMGGSRYLICDGD